MKNGLNRYGAHKKWLPYALVWVTIPGSLYLAYAPPLSELWPAKSNAGLAQAVSERISKYDEIIHRHSRKNQIDWRLVASMINAESSFRHDAVSPAGAKGLMQIMPVVAREQGVSALQIPEKNIEAGIRHYKRYSDSIRGQTAEDSLALSLAAYNAGLGHVRDAQRLAKKMKLNPRRWRDVSRMLLLLEEPFYHRDATYGYCKGSETVEYVSKVVRKYANYKSKYPIQPVHARADAVDPEFDA